MTIPANTTDLEDEKIMDQMAIEVNKDEGMYKKVTSIFKSTSKRKILLFDESEPVLTIKVSDGQQFRVYANGEIEGDPGDGCITLNKMPQLVAKIVYKSMLIEKAKQIDKEQERKDLNDGKRQE